MTLRTAIQNLALPNEYYCTPDWLRREQQIRDAIVVGDPTEFLQWEPCHLSMVKPNADIELAYLKSLPDWKTRWEPVVQESSVGAMPRYPEYPGSSGILLRHAAIVAWWEQVTGLDITLQEFILEFGGGHGGMCRLLHRLGFQGTYVIYDLPAVVLLQQYYLTENGIEKVESTWDFDALPLYVAEHLAKKSIFIATWSLSETPYSIRDALFPLVMDFGAILIAAQHWVHSFDNMGYFDSWQTALPDMTWHRKDVRKVMWLAGIK